MIVEPALMKENETEFWWTDDDGEWSGGIPITSNWLRE